jgi:hypothetical protein
VYCYKSLQSSIANEGVVLKEKRREGKGEIETEKERARKGGRE